MKVMGPRWAAACPGSTCCFLWFFFCWNTDDNWPESVGNRLPRFQFFWFDCLMALQLQVFPGTWGGGLVEAC